MDIKVGYYNYTNETGAIWPMQCVFIDVKVVRPKLRSVASLRVQEKNGVIECELSLKVIKELIEKGHKFERIDNKTDIAKALLNGL